MRSEVIILKDRIKLIRKNAGLTQSQFAKSLGTVQNTITGYETGRRNPSGSAITLICREFNVNEEWLRTGVGEMYVNSSDTDYQSILDEIGVKDTNARQLIVDYWHMNSADKELFWRFIDRFIKK